MRSPSNMHSYLLYMWYLLHEGNSNTEIFSWMDDHNSFSNKGAFVRYWALLPEWIHKTSVTGDRK